MRKMYYVVILFLTLFWQQQVVAQEDILVVTERSFLTGEAADLEEYLNDLVELNIDQNRNTLSRAEAKNAIDKFIKENRGGSFEYLHKGNTEDNLHYAIGNFTSKDKKEFRVYVLIKNNKISTLDLSGK